MNAMSQAEVAVEFRCRVCGTQAAHPRYSAREMMFGTRELFEYVQCGACGCLQIAEFPADPGAHYGGAYYSFKENPAAAYRQPLKNLLNRWRDQLTLLAPGGDRLPFQVSVPHLRTGFQALRRVPGLSLDSRIVDIGCGSGLLLHRLHNAGFRSLTGADPFLDGGDREVGPGFRMLQSPAETLQGSFDVVLMNHSFEHVPDPAGTMAAVKRLLAPGGTALIRVPLCDGEAWERYRGDWFQLDAPRHFYLHTQRSLRLLSEQAGLEVAQVVHDSDHHQFTFSERYRQDAPLVRDPQRPDGKPSYAGPSEAQIAQYQARAEQLNREGRGDQASFYLRHVPARTPARA